MRKCELIILTNFELKKKIKSLGSLTLNVAVLLITLALSQSSVIEKISNHLATVLCATPTMAT